MYNLNEHQEDLIHRAINRWLNDLDEFEIYSASDEHVGSEAIYILRDALSNLSVLFDPEGDE